MAAKDVDRAEKAHRHTYSLFTGIMKYGAIISFVTAMVVVLLISD